MFELVVSDGSGRSVTVQASCRRALQDHLLAAADRHGMNVVESGEGFGTVWKAGRAVSDWEISPL